MKVIQAAIIGAGGAGKYHAKTLLETNPPGGPAKFKLAAFCDTQESARAGVEKDFPGVPFYSSLDSLFKNEKLDFVTIATPHNLHKEHAMAAAKAGVNAIVEKPMATSYADTQEMIASAKKAKTFLTVFHNRRLDPWFLSAMSLINDGMLGNVVELFSGIGYGTGWDLKPAKDLPWRAYKVESGGLMFDWGAHLVDYVLNFAKSEVDTVAGFLHTRPGKDKKLNEDHGTITIRFKSGVIATVMVSGVLYGPTPRYRLFGDKGTYLDDWIWDEKTGKGKLHTRLSSGESMVSEVGYRNIKPGHEYYERIARHFNAGEPIFISPESAALVINVICSAERSAKKGGVPVKLE